MNDNCFIIIFSKDRPAQLDLLLRSMEKYFKEYKTNQIYILYTYSNNDFKLGYQHLIDNKEDLNLHFIKEKKFKEDLNNIIKNTPPKDFILFFTDDDVFKESFSFNDPEVNAFKKDINVVTLSLRLHPNLTHCYTAKIKHKIPIFEKYNKYRWEEYNGDYGYPMSIDGHIFRINDIYNYIVNMNYSNPNTFEGGLAKQKARPFIMCYEKSKILNIPINRVQNVNKNRAGNISTNWLNQQWLSGKEIKMENIDGLDNISCHQEINLIIK